MLRKTTSLGNALALVAPYDWSEPFGLVLIEALACGIPVVAYRRGSIPEVLEDGVTGFICETMDEMATAIGRIPQLERRRCREQFEQRFTVERMAQDYLGLYEELVDPQSIRTDDVERRKAA